MDIGNDFIDNTLKALRVVPDMWEVVNIQPAGLPKEKAGITEEVHL